MGMDESNHHGLINPKNQSMYIIYIIYCIQYYTIIFNYCVTEGSLEVKLPTTWKSQKKESEERVGRKSQKKESEEKVRRKSQKKEDAGAQKGRKVATHCVFQMICGFVGSKSRLAKAAGAEPPGLMRNEKLHAVVTRSTFQNQNVLNNLNIPFSEHFWKLRSPKSARCFGAKHISK
jgi:hypothetical protein